MSRKMVDCRVEVKLCIVRIDAVRRLQWPSRQGSAFFEKVGSKMEQKGIWGVSKGLPMREGGFTERQSSSEVDYGKKSRTATSAKAQRKIASMSFSKDQKKVELA